MFFFFSIFSLMLRKERLMSTRKKNGILVIFRTRIIHKLTASCLQLSFHLTFKFLVLRTNSQFFLFLLLSYIKCKTAIQSGHSYADFSIWNPKILGNCSGNVFLRFSLELKVGLGERFGPLSLTNEQAYTTCCMPRSSLILHAGMRSFHPHDYYIIFKHWHILQFKKA